MLKAWQLAGLDGVRQMVRLGLVAAPAAALGAFGMHTLSSQDDPVM